MRHPRFAAFADSHFAALKVTAHLRAVDARGLLAKARAIDARDAAMRSDGAVSVALSPAIDVVLCSEIAEATEPESHPQKSQRDGEPYETREFDTLSIKLMWFQVRPDRP